MAENLLLAALPADERNRLEPFLEPVELKFGQILIYPDEPITQTYFPYDAVTSTIQLLEDGGMVETGLMGVEGMVGFQIWLRVNKTPSKTLIQVDGTGHRMSADDFRREVIEKPESPMNLLVARYAHAFLNMTSQSAACNRLHSVDQRLCRWLRLVYNRVRRDVFPIRQDFLAQMLGVSRPSVSIAANTLKKAGLISYSRGTMRVTDPQGLADGSCQCLEMMESQFDRIFDVPWRDMAKEEDETSGRDLSGLYAKDTVGLRPE